ncbi:SDR family oxidoreductase [Alginatibacterium sediminis]|uniref:SDR family oxidoreductase n=1 Tax=Alginatibacterium sediminis TaxID=2164068 RepID=A0A420EB89_9ALTE|nr:SDR family oxidoreductase [Alginatibacterium sediminis]RKF17946.1 SDR family oxidoreductase [Alginatibacterium sediminis]
MANILVTGANRGIGLGLVQRYLKQGHAVIATCRNIDTSPELSKLSLQYSKLRIQLLDVNDESSIIDLGHCLTTLQMTLDMLINNAGISIMEPFEQWSIDAFEQSMRTNCIGPALLVQNLIKQCNTHAKIINFTSGVASMSHASNSLQHSLDAYAVSKTALNMLTIRLASYLAERDISCYALNPGWVQTQMGGPKADDSVEQVVEKLVPLIEGLKREQSGQFINIDGEILAW